MEVPDAGYSWLKKSPFGDLSRCEEPGDDLRWRSARGRPGRSSDRLMVPREAAATFRRRTGLRDGFRPLSDLPNCVSLPFAIMVLYVGDGGHETLLVDARGGGEGRHVSALYAHAFLDRLVQRGSVGAGVEDEEGDLVGLLVQRLVEDRVVMASRSRTACLPC